MVLKSPFKGMEEMYTSPRKKDADVVKSILRTNKIPYRSQEEQRENGWRYCIYTPKRNSDKIYKLLDEELSMRDM
jgi:hypothetical protein